MDRRAPVVLLLLVVGGFIEGAGLLLLVPLLGAIGLDVSQGAVGRLGAFVGQAFSYTGIVPTLPRVLVIFVLVNALLAACKRLQTSLAGSVEQQVVHRVRVRLYDAILHMDWLALSRRRASDLTVALTTECERVGYAASQVLTIAGALVVTTVYIVFAWRLSPLITGGVIGAGTFMALLLRHRATASKALGSAFSQATNALQAVVSDDLSGLKSIRGYGAEARSLARFEGVSRRIGEVRTANVMAYAASSFWLEAGSAFLLSALVLIAVEGLGFSASSLLLLLFVFARVMPRLSVLQQNIQFYLHVVPSATHVATLQAECEAAAQPRQGADGTRPLTTSVALREVSFGYEAGGPPTIDRVSFTLPAGSVTAIVGPSGAGKTTIVDLLLGLLHPAAGALEVDGQALGPDDLAGWRRSIAYVPQDMFLFHDTVRANLLWAAPDASEADMWEALESAHAAAFIRVLPAQLDTVLGDRGTRLSGGERQRLALARALLKRPALLVLDEATSSLDTETEARVLDVVFRLRGRLTVVMVTHRVQSVRHADLIHVIEHGRVVESGSWDALAARPDGRMRDLLSAQPVESTPA